MLKRVIVSIVIALILASCNPGIMFGERINKARPEMTTAEIKKEFGDPEGYKKDGDIEIYSYYNKLISGWAWDRADYHFIFQNKKLIQWGAGEIRQNQTTGTFVLIPMNF